MRFLLRTFFKKLFVTFLFTKIADDKICHLYKIKKRQHNNCLETGYLHSDKINLLRKIKILTGYRLILKHLQFVTDPWINEDGVIKLLKRGGIIRRVILELISFNKIRRIHSAFYSASRHGTKVSEPNYAHFLLEDLPVIKLWLEEYRDNKLLLRPNAPKWVKEILFYCGVYEQEYSIDNSPLLVSKLFVAKKPFIGSHKYENNHLRTEMISDIKSSVLESQALEKIKKPMLGEWIFIDRCSASRRKISNNDEILGIVKKFGFSIIEPSSYSFAEQVCIFSNCTLILGQSGAALVNGCFMNPGSHMIELNHGEFKEGPTCWQLMCDEFDLDYKTIYPQNSVSDFDNDIMVNAAKLENLLLKISPTNYNSNL